MKWKVSIGLVLVIATLTSSMPPESSSRRQAPPIGDTIKKLTNQLMELNTTSDITLDTRTPPRVKQQTRKKVNVTTIENSHAGIAVPIDEDTINLEENTKKLNFYKIENKATTDSGLSTWILLSGHGTTGPQTTNTPRNPLIKEKPESAKNVTVVATEFPSKIKPIFKKRPVSTTTKKPTTATVLDKDSKLTKIKASVLNGVIANKTKVENNASVVSTTSKPSQNGTTLMPGKILTTPQPKKNITEIESTTSSLIDSNLLPLEAKDGDRELSNNTTQPTKKNRRPSNKRKKNKNKRRRPSIDKSDTNSTKIAQKEKPIGTQIYNYLSREVMPTVGVGLVGLMVTAGLAGYFLYPFGGLRRSYEIDRKDNEGSYHYSDEYNTGVAEEEMIGKVIAGMPLNSNYNSYRSPTTRDSYPNIRYRQVDHRYSKPQASIETVQLTPSENYNNEEVVLEDSYVPQRSYKPKTYSPQINYENLHPAEEPNPAPEDKKFVVGNIPTEAIQEMTPAAVPEHGPRSLKVRRRRHSNDLENEILYDDEYHRIKTTHTSLEETTETTQNLTSYAATSETSTTLEDVAQRPTSFISFLKSLIELKIRLGLELLQNTTRTISRYLSEVQSRLNETHNNSQPRKL